MFVADKRGRSTVDERGGRGERCAAGQPDHGDGVRQVRIFLSFSTFIYVLYISTCL